MEDRLLVMPAEMAAAIVQHAQQGHPEEVCGLVAGVSGRAAAVFPGRNISPTPRIAYELDHETLARMIDFEDAGLELAAIYHSHPKGPGTPSRTDVERAFYPEAVHLIVNLADRARPAVRGYRIVNGAVHEVEVISPDGPGQPDDLDQPRILAYLTSQQT